MTDGFGRQGPVVGCDHQDVVEAEVEVVVGEGGEGAGRRAGNTACSDNGLV